MIKLILLLVLLITIGFSLIKYGEHKTELKLRDSDKKLKQYFYEMNDDRKDGWEKNHYAELYYSRLKELKHKAKKDLGI
jgi:outer membrane lipoprotein-sorting protein